MAPASPAALSHLLAATITGLPLFLSASATIRSPAVNPTRASITKRQTSASRIAVRVCTAMRAVTRHTGRVIDNGQALAGEPIEQRRFPDIGPADNGYGKGHLISASGLVVANPKFASAWATLRANFGFTATLAIN